MVTPRMGHSNIGPAKIDKSHQPVSNKKQSPSIITASCVQHKRIELSSGQQPKDGYYQQRPRPPSSGLPLSINKIYRRMYSNVNNCLVGYSSADVHQSSPVGGVVLRQYFIPRNPNNQFYKHSPPPSKSAFVAPLNSRMGAFLDKPRTEKSNESGQGAGLRYGIAAMQGWRVEMEDAHTARAGTDLPAPWSDWAFFAIFDGHAGSKVARYSACNLLESIWNTSEMQELSKHLPLTKLESKHMDAVLHAIKKGFLQLDDRMCRMSELHSDNERSGSTAVCCVVSPSHLFLGNLGDSRALISRNGQVHFATEDHKPYLPKERDRIVNAGGSVMIQRVNGSLAVSRALGDYEYKSVPGLEPSQQLVSPEPDLHVIERDPIQSGGGRDEFLVLACDGVFDVMTNHELCDFVRSRLRVTDRLELICNQILDSCLSKGSKDNMSVILVTFPGAPQVSNEAVDKEKELEARLRERIHSILSTCDAENDRDDIDADYILRLLMNQEIPGVPPGAGLHAMRPLVESILDSIMTSSSTSNKSASASACVMHHQASPTPSPASSPLRVATSPAPSSNYASSPHHAGKAGPVSPLASQASPEAPSIESPVIKHTITACASAPPKLDNSHEHESQAKKCKEKSN